jgi:Xaa-Pro aminopeptidase
MTAMPDPELKAFVDARLEELRAREPDIPFPQEEYDARLQKLRGRMQDSRVDLLLVSSPEGACWLHGYRSRWNKMQSPTEWPPLQMTAVHAHSGRTIAFDTTEHENLLRLTSVSPDNRLSVAENMDGMLPFIVKELEAEGWLGGTVGIEKWSPVPNRAVSEAVEAELVTRGSTIVDASALVREVRRIKSPREIAYVEEAVRICDAGLEALRRFLKPGVSELEAWAELLLGMAAEGGEPAGIHECVVVGPAELGHMFSSTRRIKQGDSLFADPSGVRYRYHGNVAKAFYMGEPPKEALRIAEIEAGAYPILCEHAKAGTPVRDVNKVLREYYVDAGVWGLHDWTGGYELGISFPPDWVGEFVFTVDDEDPEEVFEAGMVTNYESMVHYAMIDTIVYEADGARALSSLPHELVVID